jgi:hypothetical protein
VKKKIIVFGVFSSIILASVVLLVGFVSANEEGKLTVTEVPGEVIEKQSDAEKAKEKALFKQIDAQSNQKEKVKIATKLIEKEISPDNSTGRAKLIIGSSDNNDLLNLLNEQKIRVVHWVYEIENQNGELFYIGMHSRNNLRNEQNLKQLEEVTSEIIQKDFKGQMVTKRLESLTVVGSTEAINNLGKEVNK